MAAQSTYLKMSLADMFKIRIEWPHLVQPVRLSTGSKPNGGRATFLMLEPISWFGWSSIVPFANLMIQFLCIQLQIMSHKLDSASNANSINTSGQDCWRYQKHVASCRPEIDIKMMLQFAFSTDNSARKSWIETKATPFDLTISMVWTHGTDCLSYVVARKLQVWKTLIISLE